MTREEVIEFVNAHGLFFLGTSENGKPRVRAMMASFADVDGGIVFSTGEAKDVARQLAAAPDVELCFHDPATNVQVRIRGTVEKADDLDLKQAVVEKFEFLKPWIDEVGYEAMACFRLRSGHVAKWTMDQGFQPCEFTDF